MMHQVAGDHRVLALRRNPHAVMAGSVTGTWFEPDFVGHAKIRVDQLGHPFVDDRAHRILDRIAHIFSIELRPVIPFGAAD